MAETAPAPALMLDRWGDIQQITPDQMPDALAAGYVAASPKQIEQYEADQKYGGFGQQTIAGIEGAASALSFGASDWLERGLGISTPEEMQAREDAGPGHGIGTALGIGLPIAATLGAAAPAEGAAGVARGIASKTAPALISKLGQSAAGVVERALPEATTLAGRIAVKGIAGAAAGGAEGAAYQAQQIVHEAALGDPGLSGESIAAHFGIATALGGGLGALIGVAEPALPAILEKAQAASKRVFDSANGVAKNVAVSVLAKTTGVGNETISDLLANQSAIFRDPAARTKLATEVGDSLGNYYRTMEQSLKAANRDIRPIESEVFTAGIEPTVVQNEAYQTLAKFDSTIETMRAQPELYPAMYAKKLELIRDGFARNVADTDAYGVFSAVNDAKQELDPLARFGRDIPPEHIDAITTVKALRADLKNSLQSQTTWGEAGARQASFNEAQNEYLTVQKEFQKKFMQKTVTKTGAVTHQIDPVKVNTYLNQMADARGKFRSEVLNRYMGAAEKLTGEMDASFRNAPVGGFDRPALDELTNRTGDLVQQARRQAAATQMVNQLGQQGAWGSNAVAHSGGPMDILGMLGGIGVGHMIGGPVGTAIGAATTAYKFLKGFDVPRAVATLAGIQRVLETVQKQVDTGVSTLVRAGPKATNIGRSEAAAGIAKSFGRSLDDSKALYLKRVAEIQRLSDPAQQHQMLTEQTDGLHEHAPDTAQALNVTTARALSYLASKIPQGPQRGPLGPKWSPNQSQIASFNRAYEAVAENPLHVLKQAAAGTLSKEATEAFQTVFPKLHEQVRQSIVEGLTKQPKGVPYGTTMMLSRLFGAPLDQSTTGLMIGRTQATLNGPQAKGPGNPPGSLKPTSNGLSKLSLSERALTPMQQSAARK